MTEDRAGLYEKRYITFNVTMYADEIDDESSESKLENIVDLLKQFGIAKAQLFSKTVYP